MYEKRKQSQLMNDENEKQNKSLFKNQYNKKHAIISLHVKQKRGKNCTTSFITLLLQV